jgi:formylmethanofuran dehydrogenase subunit E
MKYYSGYEMKIGKPIKCDTCNKKDTMFKLREDKKLVCFDCYKKDKEPEEIKR